MTSSGKLQLPANMALQRPARCEPIHRLFDSGEASIETAIDFRWRRDSLPPGM